MTRAQRQALAVFAATVAFAAGALLLAVRSLWTYPNASAGGARGRVELEIPRGAGAGQVAALLHERRLIERPALFRLYARQRKIAARFKAGRYVFEAPLPPREIVDALVRGPVEELVTVTIPEGKTLIEVAELLAAANVAPRDALLARAVDAAFARRLDVPGRTLEGYLYPDTYKFRAGAPPDDVLAHLVKRHRQVYAELGAEHAAALDRVKAALKFGDHQLVILASIVERETAERSERPRIAQVFVNRLVKPSFQPKLLQTDPTIVYGCQVAPLFLGAPSQACAAFEGRLRRIHLDDPDNPYNTYAHPGLPPGPIANPGRAALAAVMNPDGSPYLYFVSRNDGTHQFSATLAEHEAAVVRYQRGGRALP